MMLVVSMVVDDSVAEKKLGLISVLVFYLLQFVLLCISSLYPEASYGLQQPTAIRSHSSGRLPKNGLSTTRP